MVSAAARAMYMGIAALLLAMPCAWAQLPDAPSAVQQASSEGPLSQLAANALPLPAPQQSLYTAPPNSPPGYSSSTAERYPVPGETPALRSSCPLFACLVDPPSMCCGPLPSPVNCSRRWPRKSFRPCFEIPPSPFERYLKEPATVPLTARDNLHSAVMHVIDPFNLGTIAADAAIGIALDPHSVYGPGIEGTAKYAGVSLTEDMTGEFFGTFLIPSLLHQDPRYHREPFMPIKHRILHAITQVVWAQSYTGKPMPNYANLLGGVATAVISNTFVPGPNRQGFDNTAQRLVIAFAISPSGNLISEFVPDIANRINLRVVIFQRILNTISLEESGVP